MDLIKFIKDSFAQVGKAARNIKGAIDAAEYWAENGLVITKVDAEIYQIRLGICELCDNYNKVTSVCGICGCPMIAKAATEIDPMESVKQKKQIKTACPLQKW